MAEKVEIDIEVNSNVEQSIAGLKELKKQLKETAAGSADFKKLANEIDDLEDKIKGSRQGAADWIDTLESAGGPIGALGKGLNSAKVATVSFGTALKATGIGLVVAAIGGLVAAFSQSETAMKKLQPLFIAFEKILGGIFRAFEPVLDAFIELATSALPYITKGIGMFYSGLYSLFTLVKNVGVSVGKILKGVFTLDFDALKEGAAGIKDAFTGVAKTFNDTYARFEAGTKEQTKTEKEELDKRNKNAADAAAKKKAAAEKAAAEAEKLRQENLKKAEAADAVELEAFKATLTEREQSEYEAGLKLAEQRKVLAAAGRTDMTAIEEQYRITLAEIKKKYDDEEAKKQEEIDKKNAENLKKKLEDERGIILTNLQAKFEDLDRENAKIDGDFAADLERLAAQRDILAEQERTELANTELTEFQKTEIRKKYSDARIAITNQEIATEKAAAQAKHEINMAYLGLFEQFGNVLGQVAGKNKALAIAGIVISQAAAIGQIIASTGIANAKAIAVSPLTFGMPWVAINTISAGLSIASVIAGAVKSIQQVNQAASQAGVSGGGGGGSVGGAAPSLPKVGGMAAPQVQTQSGNNPSSQIAQTIAMSQQKPMRAYVVGQDISSQQALDRRTNVAATFSSGG
uniref:Uncharacterized protein n=1 Tax=uncultured Caudovirales phage TaxID=2100421 RepID=A0A6J7WYU9_9CAUD|nr:hypothetical protein UFOVP385_6 [uncultured Caudovirales phage]